MIIVKRTGNGEEYRREKILRAIQAAFASTGSDTESPIINLVTSEIEQKIEKKQEDGEQITVETIQDLVEQGLIAHNRHAEVRNFILYREAHAKEREARNKILSVFATIGGSAGSSQYSLSERLQPILKGLRQDFPAEQYSTEHLWQKFFSFLKDDIVEKEALSMLIKAAVELTTQEAPRWEFIASRILNIQFRIQLENEMRKQNLNSFYDKIQYLTTEGLYGSYISLSYSEEEIAFFESKIEDSRDKLLTFSALDLLIRRYVIRTRKNKPVETPQEMFMGIAMHLAMKETEERSMWVLKFYDVLSTLKITVATPTLSNARKPYHQLSSCFIDTVPDSLDGIYRSINNFAQVSKFGGGMGMYFGKVRAVGGPIRGFQGVAGGIIRWIKLANDTAVAVDQLGVRQGSVAVYLDAWHKDLPEFLQLKTNNGDDRMKAHDVFPAICYPDLFWKTVRDNIDANWYLMCPHEILTVKGYALEDSWGDEWEKKYKDCVADARISKREIPLKEIVRLILKSAVETGTPFAFNRDHVNRMNPNSHKGVIYCSNLCTEIAQNMSAIDLVKKEIQTKDGDTVVVETTRPGDFVVCNLASLVLGNIDIDSPDELENIIATTVRALDNVIDLNYYPLPYAEITNQRYRSIGLGTSGYHHLLAKRAIKWESEEHLEFANTLYERINRAAINASA
ncbi:MAG TPA: ribonucleoside-diphosphate reductase subunit alpha, partial [Treponemataceae bacterium]|nr:ribonucleoside-diphosphate reductase subunit alpha [Treponemataceae bacterium]